MRSPEERAREVIEAHTGMPYKVWMSGGPGYKPNSWEALSDKIAAAIREAVEAEREACDHRDGVALVTTIYLNTYEWCQSCGAQRITATDDDEPTEWVLPAIRARQKGEG